jgi:hypothetical protein
VEVEGKEATYDAEDSAGDEDRVDRSEAAVILKSPTSICGPTRSRRRFVKLRCG